MFQNIVSGLVLCVECDMNNIRSAYWLTGIFSGYSPRTYCRTLILLDNERPYV
jgi:hypothetical protein